jgi:beta-glucosidase
MICAHAKAYLVIHELQKDARVGIAINYQGFRPASGFPPNRWMASFLSKNFNNTFPQALKDGRYNFAFKKAHIPEAAGAQDFLGLNYYTVNIVRFNLFAPKAMFTSRRFPVDAPVSETGFIASVPSGMMDCVRWGSQFGLPMIITENGVEDSTDELRPQYLVEHLHALWQIMNGNYPVEGYFHWSLVDNFEWERGWSQRFGLWGLDLETQSRIRRPSVDLYAEICRTNGISAEIVENYAPQSLKKLFP